MGKAKEAILKIPYWVKMGITTITVIGALVGVVIAVEDRYVDQAEIATSLSQFDNKIQQDLVRVDLRILNMQYDNYTEHYYDIKGRLRVNPTDQELIEELEQYKELRQKTKEEINSIIR
jgi:predicted acylesterase/phospholipase RssA